MLRQEEPVVKLGLTRTGVFLLALLISETLTSALCGIYPILATSLLLLTVLCLPVVLTYKRVKINLIDVEIVERALLGEKYQCYIDVEAKSLPAGFRYSHIAVLCSSELDVTVPEVSWREDGTARIVFTLRGLHVGTYMIDGVVLMFKHVTRLFHLKYFIELRREVKVESKSIVIVRAILGGRGIIPGLGEAEVPKPSRIGLEYFGSRPFMPGDDYRFIDWRATARTGKLYVKEFYSSGTGSVQIVLNLIIAVEPIEIDSLVFTFLSLVYSLLLAGFRLSVRVLFRSNVLKLELRGLEDLRVLAERMLEPLTHEIESCRKVVTCGTAEEQNHEYFRRDREPLIYIATHRIDMHTLSQVTWRRYALIAIPITSDVYSQMPHLKLLGLHVVYGDPTSVVYRVLERLSRLLM